MLDLDFQCHPHSVQTFQPYPAQDGNVQCSVLIVNVVGVTGVEGSLWGIHKIFSLSFCRHICRKSRRFVRSPQELCNFVPLFLAVTFTGTRKNLPVYS